MALNESKVQEVEIQGYELWELGSEDDLSNYEFETLREYDSDNSDSLNFSIQTIETFDTFEESIRENSNQHESQTAQIFQKNSFGVEKQFESQVHEDHKYGNTGCRVFKRWVQNYKDFCICINQHTKKKRKLLNFENWCT